MSLMEISQWQHGNYSTAWIMLAWHLYCHWLCPCEEQSTDQSPKTKEHKRSGTENELWLYVLSCSAQLLFRHHKFVKMLRYLIFFSVTSTERERKYTCGLRTPITSYTANVGFQASPAFQRPTYIQGAYTCWLPCRSRRILVFCMLRMTPALTDGATFGNDKDIF